jgi:serine/threonine protein kinase
LSRKRSESSSRDSWALAEGDALTPELTVISNLGGGAAYEAYLAFDEVTYAAVVAKVVRPAQVDDESIVRGLRREARALRRLNHPALVRGLRSTLDGDRPHLVLEHLDGPRLSTLVRTHGPLSPQQYLPLAVEVASVLHYMHGQGYVHLDVKPSNIIMGAPAKLIDVSLARRLDRVDRLRTPVGTDAWMAPEQAAPQRAGVPGAASDVWGLGASLFHAVSGQRPFDEGVRDAGDPVVEFPQLVDEPRPLPESVPAPVAGLVLDSLLPDPAERPTPAQLADEFALLLGQLPQGRLSGIKTALSRR